jgi:hypothetical protein
LEQVSYTVDFPTGWKPGTLMRVVLENHVLFGGVYDEEMSIATWEIKSGDWSIFKTGLKRSELSNVPMAFNKSSDLLYAYDGDLKQGGDLVQFDVAGFLPTAVKLSSESLEMLITSTTRRFRVVRSTV